MVRSDKGRIMTDKRKAQNKEHQQKHRDKLKHDKPIVKELIAKLRKLLDELDKR